MKIEWIESALDDMESLKQYIERENVRAAKQGADKVVEAVSLFRDTPRMGRDGRLAGTKELVVSGTSYIVMYKIQGNKVRIMRVLHHAMQWPDTKSDKGDDDGWFFM